jgi:hypothetical protein
MNKARLAAQSRLPGVDRQFIAGTTKVGGWFGSIKGAGYFKKC